MILDFIFKHIPILKQLQDFSSVAFSEHIMCLRQLPEFINVNLQVFTHFVSYESEFYLNCGFILKNGKVGMSRKRDNVSNSGYVRKWKT